ncbi:hypothetical protein, partial [Nocardia sp. NPDC057353]|uniref:hypothetical protein n=1 Tax=Nocardia sp. NPDC057353 TaxID=3346104 RepID=UPI0036315273
LSGIGLGHGVHPSSSAPRHHRSDVTNPCSSPPDWFYRDHKLNAKRLVEEGLSEVQHRVTALLARARKNLTLLEERLGSTLFQETTDRLEEDAAEAFEAEGGWAVDRECPECGFNGRMIGSIDLDRTCLYDDEGEAYGFDDWEITMSAHFFGCNVCRLTLSGMQEFAAAGLPAYSVPISADDLGPDFDAEREAERLYGIND